MRSAMFVAPLLAAALSPAWGAPVPLRRPAPRPPHPLVGTWAMTWGTAEGKGVFRSDGSYEHHLLGCRYVGTWRLERGPAGVMTLLVREALVWGADGRMGPWKDWQTILTPGPGAPGFKGVAAGDYGDGIDIVLARTGG